MDRSQRIVAIDPGGTIGVAFVNGSWVQTWHFPYTELEAVVGIIGLVRPGLVIVEDYLGSGPRSADSQRTTKQIGFLEGICLLLEIPVKVVPPARRKPWVAKAGQHTTHIHEADALAHAFAEQEKSNG